MEIFNVAGALINTIIPIINPTGIISKLITSPFVQEHGENVIRLDARNADHADDTDETHIYLQGPLTTSENFFECINTNTSLVTPVFEINSSGGIVCGNIVSVTTTNLDNRISDIEEDIVEISAGSQDITDAFALFPSFVSENTPKTIVFRDEHGKSDFSQLHIKNLEGVANIQLHADAQLFFIPYEWVGDVYTPKTSVYRFGANQEEVTDLTTAGDGIEMVDNNNQILIQVQKNAPTIDIQGEKNAGVPFMRIKNQNSQEIFTITDTGAIESSTVDDLYTAIANISDDRDFFEEDSVYIGSLKLSYRRSDHKFMVKRLALDHVPNVLSAQGFTASDLPGDKTINTMNIKTSDFS